MGNDQELRMGSSLNLPHATGHLVMEASSQPASNDKQSPSRKILYPQALPFPLWHLSLFCIYWSGQSSTSLTPKGGIGLQDTRDIIASLVDLTGTTIIEDGVYVRPDIRTLVLPMLSQSSFHSMLNFQRIASLAVAIQRWWPSKQHTGFQRDMLYGTLWRGLPNPRLKVEGPGMKLGQCLLSLTLKPSHRLQPT